MVDNWMKKVNRRRCIGIYINFRSFVLLVVVFFGWRSIGNFDFGINVNESINRKKNFLNYDLVYLDF